MKIILVFATLIALGLSYSCPEKDIDFEQGGFDSLNLGPDSSWEDCGDYLTSHNIIHQPDDILWLSYFVTYIQGRTKPR